MSWTKIKTAIGWACSMLVAVEILAAILAAVAVKMAEVPPELRGLAGPDPWLAMGLSMASGVFIDRQGDVVTNEHVVAGCRRVTIAGEGFSGLRATLVASRDDSFQDLTVLHVDHTSPSWLMFEDQPAPRENVSPVFRAPAPMTILGFPGMMKGTVPRSASVRGIMLTHPVDDDAPDHWQLNVLAPIAPGNSGSPMVDGHGNLAGLVVRGTFPDRTSYAQGHAAGSGDALYGRYVLDWLHGVGVPAVVATPDQPPRPPGAVAAAVVRVFCFGRRDPGDISIGATRGARKARQ